MAKAFRYPFDIQSTLDSWRPELGASFDQVVAHLSDRDRALEDFLGRVTRDTVGDYFINPRLGLGETSFSAGVAEPLEVGGTGAGISFVDRDDFVDRWALYASADKFRFWDGTADRVTFDRTTGNINTTNSRIQQYQTNNSGFAEFSALTRGNGPGDYSFVSQNSSPWDTYVNAATGGTVHLRINNTDSMTVNSDRSLHGSFGPGTMLEAVSDGTLVTNGSGNPNYILQAGTVVGSFSGGNCAFTFGNAFPSGVNGIVTCEAGGNPGWICGNQNVSRTGFGVYLKNDAGSFASGLFRINYVALGF